MYAGNDYPEPITREDQLLNITDYGHEIYSETNMDMEDSFESIISDSDVPNYPIEPHTEIDNSIENVENIVATSTPINTFPDEEPIDTNDLDTLFSPFGITGDTSIPDTSIPDTSISDTSIPDTSISDTSISDIISLSDAEALIVLCETQTLEFVAKLRMLSGDQYPIIEPILNKIIDLIAEKNLGFDCETISDSRGEDTIIHLYDKTIHDQNKYDTIVSFRESDQMVYP